MSENDTRLLKPSSNLSENKTKLHCDKCDKPFSSARTLKDHIKWIHGNHEKVECNICQEIMNNKKSLRLHIYKKHQEGSNSSEKNNPVQYFLTFC